MSTVTEDDREPLRLRRPLLHPSRWPVAAGFALVAVGVIAPWQEIAYPMGLKQVINGASGADAPGLQVLLFAALTTLVCALPAAAGSRTRSVQLLPVLGAAATVILAVRAYLAVSPRAWDPSQSSQVIVEWGMWSVLAGTALIAVGGLATTLTIVRDRPLAPEPWEPKADMSFVRPLVAALTGFVLALAGAELFVSVVPRTTQLAVPLLFIGTVVAAFGVYGLLGLMGEVAASRRGRHSPGSGPGAPDLEPLQRRPRR
jgi:hypothetical protein